MTHQIFSATQPARKLSTALWWRGGKRKESLQLRLLEFEYLHQKSRCKMFIGGNDIGNVIFTPGMCFSMFVYIHTCFPFALIGGNLTAQSKGSHREIGGGIQILETLLQALLPFPTTLPECPGELARRLSAAQHRTPS